MPDIQPWNYQKETYGQYVLEHKKELGTENTSLWGKNGAVEQAAIKQGIDLTQLKVFVKNRESVNNSSVADKPADEKSANISSNIFGASDFVNNIGNSRLLFPGNNQSDNKNLKVIIEGDSLATEAGYGNKLKKLLGNNVETVDLAHSGDTLAGKIEPELQSVMNEYNPGKKNIVVLTAGTNDIHGGAKAKTVYAHLLETAKELKEKGFKVVVGTCIKLNGAGDNAETPEKLAERKKYNDLIRNTSSAPWDKAVDLGSLKEFDDNPMSAVTENRDIYNEGRVHLTDVGYKTMANALYRGLQDV